VAGSLMVIAGSSSARWRNRARSDRTALDQSRWSFPLALLPFRLAPEHLFARYLLPRALPRRSLAAAAVVAIVAWMRARASAPRAQRRERWRSR
jgi:hypothetical protein